MEFLDGIMPKIVGLGLANEMIATGSSITSTKAIRYEGIRGANCFHKQNRR
mgnify:CR=1 FL=1